MHNVHQREMPVPATVVGALLDRLASEDDQLWPFPAWWPIKLDGPLAEGARGGHGRIRYAVESYQQSSRIRFRFAPGLGLDGFHELIVEPRDAQACVLRHVMECRPTGAMVLVLPLAVRWLHDALIEDLLDNAERVVTGTVAHPARWSAWVRLLRRLTGPKATEVPLPEHAALARDAFDRLDFVDAWQVRTWRGMPTDPVDWAQVIFREQSVAGLALLRLRNALVGLLGIKREDMSAFDLQARSEHEALIGTDSGHLDFRASILVEHQTVTASTVVTVHNWRGRLYMLPVRLVHPALVRAMLRRAVRKMAVRATQDLTAGATRPRTTA